MATIVRPTDRKYFSHCLTLLPGEYQSFDNNRMTLALFGLGGLDLLRAVDDFVTDQDKIDWIEWIYAQQASTSLGAVTAGFRGGPFDGVSYSSEKRNLSKFEHDNGHVANTYAALISLLILRDNLSRVNRDEIVRSLRDLQQPDGSFVPYVGSSEADMRFVFCACVISYILNDWSGVDIPRVQKFIRASLTYEGAFAQSPLQEAHGGSTYTAVAAMALAGVLEDTISPGEKTKLLEWLMWRQDGGFHGRPNKPADTCYSFWVGASIAILGHYDLVAFDANDEFLETTHSRWGGYSKHPEGYPDVLHSYMGLAGLSLSGIHNDIQPVDPMVNASVDTVKFMKTKSVWWRDASDS
ncbi:geranylgeranyl transferase type-1 subunit beta-like protein [Cladochytrium replicatum]|nr:geranylgeranyl transferase type-1 subunit beta-like protein [Cladochytrium replicatum]